MPRDLFGDVTRPSISIGNRKWYTVPVSLLSHSVIIAMFVALPILAAPYMPDVVSSAMPDYIVVDPPKLPPPKPKQPDLEPPPNPDVGRIVAPVDAPTGINPEKPAPESGWEDSRTPHGVITVDFDTKDLAPPPPPPVPTEPVRIGGTIRQPLKVRNVDPVYPAIAQAARVQGTVILEATLSPDGRMMNARILRSVPLLDQAALDAVRQWEYTPTMLNGVPVPVIMTITVTFTLSK